MKQLKQDIRPKKVLDKIKKSKNKVIWDELVKSTKSDVDQIKCRSLSCAHRLQKEKRWSEKERGEIDMCERERINWEREREIKVEWHVPKH